MGVTVFRYGCSGRCSSQRPLTICSVSLCLAPIQTFYYAMVLHCYKLHDLQKIV